MLGKLSDFAKFYYKNGADEILYMDVVASLYGRNSFDERDSIQKLKRETLCTEGNSSKKIVDFILSKTNVIDN